MIRILMLIAAWIAGGLTMPVEVDWHRGDLYVSEDEAGAVYRIRYPQP